MAPAGWHPITPTGLAANIYGVALAFSILSTIVLGLRVYARLSLNQFSLEDWLMCIGWVSLSRAFFIHICPTATPHCYHVPAEADAYS